ncbi:carbon-nitrogen family hydrolase [Filobacillus milosensis]|uniref:Carbon-nitrogen family hydrolase n=1 Tax=Filobacillus milosensis TaxID=94137 RepID=A0A4Y8IRN1_9BACI|nr:carbon-nitrogen family hydrolase [Filobacillus milosensis]TFB24433.1 carbon-nitrogen family hydrolase [Filobacillus milosensis]
MKISTYQMNIIPGQPEQNRNKVADWIAKDCKKNQPDTIVLPEMWTTAYTLSQLDDLADLDNQPTTSFLKELAIKNNINIIGGSFANKKNGQIYNTSIVINRKGELVYEYDKIHLVPMLNEHHYLCGGESAAKVFELEGIKMGLIICYDLRFPELIRPLALEEAEILFIVAEWPSARRHHWRTLQLARAIENQMFVISSNRIGTYDNVNFSGNSMFINPSGDIIKEGSNNEEEILTTTLDFNEVKNMRQNVPVFSSRVPDLYM